MREVAITGVGIVSSLGIGSAAVMDALRAGRSGVREQPEWLAAGLAAGVAGTIPELDARLAAAPIPRRLRPAFAPVAQLVALAAFEAVADAGLDAVALADPRTACLVGSGIGDSAAIVRGAERLAAGRPRRIDPFTVLRAMGSAPVAALVALLGLRGRAYALSSACATSAHAIGHAMELVRHGRADVVLAGGGEVIDLLVAAAFDAMRSALATGWNDRPAEASRPFAADRGGLVLASGGAVVVVEAAERARARGARSRALLLGFGAASDPGDSVLPDAGGEAEAAVMRAALDDAGLAAHEVGYLNAHATGTVAGDLAEAAAVRRVFGDRLPRISSTKSLGGHALGGAGAIEAVHTVLALEHGLLPPSCNAAPRDPQLIDLPLVEVATPATVGVALSNSFGFGGALASLALARAEG